MALVEIQDLYKSYGPVRALQNLNLEISEGSLFGLLGPNGSGKTTTLKILSTLLAPDSGRVLIDGIDVLANSKDVRQKIGYVAQEVAIDKILSGRELLQLHGDLYHLPRSNRDSRIEDLIQQLEMNEWIDRRSGSYSGGMKRRLDLAAGLMHQPKLLILDEPTVGLDIESRSTIWSLLRELSTNGTTVLLSSHYLEEVDALADQMAIIDSGELIAKGSPKELKEKLGGQRVTLKVREFSDLAEAEKIRSLVVQIAGVSQVVINRAQGFSLNFVVDDQQVLQALRSKLIEAGAELFALSESRPSLDDVYLQATGRTIMDTELEIAGKRDLKNEAKQSMR
ncbi:MULTISPECIES: daunorubicin resistance protein DrrA family ABC transporter ATP-binding protein [Prochlorococcus]|uniref:daunorubicin resistance protein DrrA family ABC transporter ATP-binding protein n=1 Tax=Prochlorococcus TaxID=1218 RepID=UPI000533AB4B|nr:MULTISPECIES: daunorubicin resistance protein DrrA family ABC transporter ATP-binding protein [Prochlorococcus]KGG12945.1 ABC-type multidrug transport system [Prochlorococcus sp. MIT 0601]